MVHLLRSLVAAPATHINSPESPGGDVQGTRPIHRLKTKELECSTAAEQALHVILWDADDDELEVLQSW